MNTIAATNAVADHGVQPGAAETAARGQDRLFILFAALLLSLLVFSNKSFAATLTLHPSEVATYPIATFYSPASPASWATVLDSNDGDGSTAWICCIGPTSKFWVYMDDPAGLAGATINSVTIYAYIRNSAVTNSARVGYMTDGATTVWGSSAALSTSYALFSAGPYTTNSAGGSLTLADINNLQIAVDRMGVGPSTMYVTEVYAVVDYTITTEYYVGNTTDIVDGVTDCNNPANTTCSLREAVNAINAAGAGIHNVHLPTGTITITGASGESNNASGDYDLKSATAQTVNFTGKGSANTIIGGGALDRIFDITSTTVTTTFTDLKLMNGTAPAGSSGGCVYSAGGNLSFTRTIVTGCSTSGTGKGGGAYINTLTANTLTIDSSTFSNNTAGSNAGAIHAASVVISGNSTFSGNSAGSSGGAIYVSSVSGSLTITSTTGKSSFTNNTTAGYGGAIYASNNASITGATFDQNHADTASQRGGAVHVHGSLGTFTDCTITNNTTAGQGGGINSLGAITINNSTISNNTASTGFGGGVYAQTTLTITAATVVDSNTAGGGGGGVYANNTAIIDGATIKNNHSTTVTTTVRGGGIGVGIGGYLTLSNSSVTNNWTFGGGGGVSSGSTATITNSTISGNKSTGSTGGGIYSQSTATITDSTVSGNSASSHGGGLVTSGDSTVTRSIFSGNSSNYTGGGIYSQNTATIIDSTVSDNIANAPVGLINSGRGGGLVTYGSAIVTRSTFSGNSGGSTGGGIYSQITATIANSTLSGNTSIATGAAIWTQDCTIINSTIYNNKATNASTVGGVYKQGTCTYTNTITANNTGNGAAANCGGLGSQTSGGYNIESANTCGFAGAGDKPNTDPKLNALASNGGLTKTHALQTGSPAIDKGNNTICAAAPINNVDQRGQTRPAGAVCDIGAFENGAYPPVEHYELSLPTGSVACMPVTATVTACADSSSPCTNRYTAANGQTATLAASAGTLGSTTVTFDASGVANTTLSYPAAADGTGVTVTLSGEQTAASSPRKCCPDGINCVVSDSCNTTFKTAGFIFSGSAGGAEATIPAQVAGVSDATYYLRAIKTNTATKACEAALTGANTVDFAYECNNPATCYGADLMSVNGGTATTIARNDNGSTLNYQSVNMTFDANGNAPFTFIYSDVGQVKLYASKAAGGALLSKLTRSSNPFVVKPYDFGVISCAASIVGACDTAPDNPGLLGGGNVFARAGKAFKATVTVRASGGAATPSFGLGSNNGTETVDLTRTRVAPTGTGAADGALGGTTSIARSSFSNGIATVSDLSWSEVGVITLTATNNIFLGNELTTTGTSGNIGRFAPDHFDTSASAPMACPAGMGCTGVSGMAYSGQTFTLDVVAKNLAGGATANYAGANGFARAVTLSAVASPGGAAIGTAAPGGTLSSTAVAAASFVAGSTAGGTHAAPVFTFAVTPSAPLDVNVRALDTDGVTSYNATTPENSIEGGVKVVSGRVKIANAHGSELLPLPMPVTVQYWGGANWLTSTTDTTALVAGNVAIANCQKNLAIPGPPPVCKAAVAVGAVKLAGGVGSIRLNAPGTGNNGSADITLNAAGWPAWLPSNTARATFGVYKGANEIIYMRENY